MPRQVTEGINSVMYVMFQYPLLSQTFVRNEVHGLRELGIDVDVLSIESGESAHIGPAWTGDFRVSERPGIGRAILDHAWLAVRRPAAYRRYLRAVAGLRDYWRVALRRLPTEARRLQSRRAPQVCHTHFGWDTASLAVYLARLLGVPASVTLHANDIYVADERRLRNRLAHFDRVVTVCNFNVGLLNGLGVSPVGSGHIDVVPCGVEVPAARSSESADTIDLVSVGRLVEKKGFDVLIRAMAVVRDRLPRVRATIVGDGPEHAALARLVSELGLEGNVELVGARSHDQALELIADARVFCLASRRDQNGDCDALPVVIREAMARAVPVISTRVAGIPEAVDDEVGWLVDPSSCAQLADAITAALSDSDERVRRGRAGRERAQRLWTIEDQADGIRRVFDQLAAEDSHSHSPV